MKRIIWLICLGLFLFLVFTGCDLYLNFLSRFGINANVEDRLKVDGQVWGLASSGGYLYAIGLEDGGPVVYKIEEDTFILDTTYQLSGGQIEDKFDNYDDDFWHKGGRFQGYTDTNAIFYLMDTFDGGRIWLNDSDNTARFLPKNFDASFTLYFSVGAIDYALNYQDFGDLTVTNIQTTTTVATLPFSFSQHLTAAVFLPETDTLQLLFVPMTTASNTTESIRETVTLTAVTLDATAIGAWTADFPYGGTANTFSLGDKQYRWDGSWEDAGTFYAYPQTRAYYSNGDLVHVSLSGEDDTSNWLFESDGTFTDNLTIYKEYRPVLSSSSRQLYGAYESIILKYGVN